MGLAKTIGKTEAIRKPLCWLVAQYVRLVDWTCRWQRQGQDIPAAYWDQGKPFILAFWHGRLLMMPRIWRQDVPIHMLISQHRDGQLIARTVAHLGIQTIQGSSTRGGAQALRTILKLLKGGACIGVTPDGPKGPRMRVSDGIISMARLSGCPIIPATFAVERRTMLKSWDRFAIAWPFGRGVFVWGQPIFVDKDLDAQTTEAARQRLETAMIELTAQADALCGHPPIEPGAPLVSAQGATP